jgi:Endonuclease related to archaeal Holliday junction resolvase
MSAMFIAAVIGVLAGAIAAVYLAFQLRFERWKTEYTKAVRRDAILRSQAATVGKVSEQLVPYFPEFQWNPRDAKFLGAPIDFMGGAAAPRPPLAPPPTFQRVRVLEILRALTP